MTPRPDLLPASLAVACVQRSCVHRTNTKGLCNSTASCKELCIKYNNGSTYTSTSDPGVMDPKLAQPIKDIPSVTGGCINCTAAPAIIEALKKLKPIVDDLKSKDEIKNNYTFKISSAYRPVKDQIRVMCTNSGQGNMNLGIQHTLGSGNTIAIPGTSNHGVGTAIEKSN